MNRRDFIVGGAGIAVGAGATYSLLKDGKKNTSQSKKPVEAPMVNKGLLEKIARD